jgi:hypothetical protein
MSASMQLNMIKMHAQQGLIDPQFAKDHLDLIIELVEELQAKKPRTSKKLDTYSHIARHFARGLNLVAHRPMNESAMIAALYFQDAKTWWGIDRPSSVDESIKMPE